MTTPIQKYMVLTFGYQDLVGISGSSGLGRIEKQIEEFNLYAILETCSKISTTLLNRGLANPLGQAELLAGIFPNKDQGLSYFEKARVKAAGSPWAIFNQQSVITLVKLACLHCNINTGKSMTPNEIEQLGYWLLLINDECFAQESGGSIVLPSREHERERLRKAMAKYQFFHISERLGYKIGRYRWIVDYFKSKKPHGVNIENLFSEAANDISLDDYITVCASLLVKWVSITTKKIDLNQDWVTCTDVYFKKTKLEKSSIDQILDILAMLPQDFKALYKESVDNVLKGQEEFHYNFMPFAWKPFIWFQDKKCFICPSSEYLFDKVTEGIYRTIENFLRQRGRNNDRAIFSIAWGDAFEQYINNSFKEAFGKDYHVDIRDKKTNEQQLDGLIDSPNFAFFIETKSMHWSYRTTVTGEIENADISIKQLFTEKGLAQIARCIRKVKKGYWSLPINIKNKKLIPVIVVSEGMPQDMYNRKLYENIADKAGSIVHEEYVLPFIILTAEEIEILEAIAKNKSITEAIQILAEYAHMYIRKNEIGLVPNAIGFKNYLYFKGYEKPENLTNNVRLLTYFDDVMNEVSLKAFGNSLRKRQNSAR